MDATSPGAPGEDADAAPESLRSKLWAAVGQSKAIRTKEVQAPKGRKYVFENQELIYPLVN
jgi:hypothetical protein